MPLSMKAGFYGGLIGLVMVIACNCVCGFSGCPGKFIIATGGSVVPSQKGQNFIWRPENAFSLGSPLWRQRPEILPFTHAFL
ncbi:hypothetical protein QNH14_22735 [Apirhabdus apintestini]|nr:hypothetical protein QNH14_22735 [Enterobacteriaceae bacterium CA-0114]